MTEDEVIRRLPDFAYRRHRFGVGTRVVVIAERSPWGPKGQRGVVVERRIDRLVIDFDGQLLPGNLIFVTDLRETDVIEDLASLA